MINKKSELGNYCRKSGTFHKYHDSFFVQSDKLR